MGSRSDGATKSPTSHQLTKVKLTQCASLFCCSIKMPKGKERMHLHGQKSC
ncbi:MULTISPECIES: hypothetical protein [Rickettsieae]|uniref:hypothetical protein n=1 Tax=Rickettsieae TaxID=33988 RepID=UPI0012FF6640|nr:hypothetical protein [Rickettsia endosymbiont of Culicoides newsteadi]